MRIGFLLLAVVAIAVGVKGQSSAQSPRPDATWRTSSLSVAAEMQRLPDGTTITRPKMTAEAVEIRVGNSILVADRAEVVVNWAGSTGPAEIRLIGNVVLKTVLNLEQK
jgi:hypothetical protein